MGETPSDRLGGDTVQDHGKRQELLVKEALYIQMTPSEERFNRNGELEVSGCWTAVMRKHYNATFKPG